MSVTMFCDESDIVKVLVRYRLLQFCIVHLQYHFKNRGGKIL